MRSHSAAAAANYCPPAATSNNRSHDDYDNAAEIIRIRLRGPRACWSRVETRAERYSNSTPSTSGLRGCTRAILSKSAVDYRFHRITLLSEPKREAITGNEFKFNNVGFKPVLASNGQHTQCTTVFMKNPDYLVEMSIYLTEKSDRPQDTLEKYYAMFRRRARRGQQEHPVVLGTRECPARLDLIEDHELRDLPPPANWTEDLGITFYGTDWDERLNYFYPLRIENGVLEYPSWDEVKTLGVTKTIGRQP